LQCFT